MAFTSYSQKANADHRLWIGKVSGAVYLKSPWSYKGEYTYTQLTPGSSTGDVGRIFKNLAESMIEPFHGEVTLSMD